MKNRISDMAAFDDNSANAARADSGQNLGDASAELLDAIRFDPGRGGDEGLVKFEAGPQGALENGPAGAEAEQDKRDEAEALALIDKLSPQQHKALQMLWDGHSLRVAAERAGVSRTTLYRWFRSDKAFAYAYNTWQRDLVETARRRLVGLSDMAVEVLARALNNGDVQVALWVLKAVGAMEKSPPGKTVL